ncbi:MAG: hypothetical protein V3V31_05240 [Methylococcales bacterium]
MGIFEYEQYILKTDGKSLQSDDIFRIVLCTDLIPVFAIIPGCCVPDRLDINGMFEFR